MKAAAQTALWHYPGLCVQINTKMPHVIRDRINLIGIKKPSYVWNEPVILPTDNIVAVWSCSSAWFPELQFQKNQARQNEDENFGNKKL